VVDKAYFSDNCISVKRVTLWELRNEFGRISKWIENGETVEIVKYGKPFAELVPKRSGKSKVLLGATPSRFPLPADIDEPVETNWKGLQ